MPAPAVPTTVYPRCEQLLQVGREAVFGTPPASTAFVSVPIADFLPNNKPTWIEDTSFWGDFVKTHDLQQGPIWAESDIKESPLYGDTFPHFLWNLLGDYTAVGTAASPNSTLNGALAVGATSVVVTSGTGFAANQWVQIDTLANAEIVQILSVASNTLTLMAATPTRFSHLTGVAITNTTSPYTHTFSLLNPNSSTGVTTGQGPSHTFIHRTNIPGAGNMNSWQFAYGCMNEITISGKVSGAMMWSGKVTSLVKAYPSFNPVASFSTVKMIPAWRGTSALAGSTVNDTVEWQITLKRELDIIPTADGYQQPYLIGRGNLDATAKLMFDPALDESILNYMINNTQPTFAQTVSNGLTGANLVSFTLNGQLTGFKDVPLKVDKTFWGWEANADLIGNTTNAGNSGGRSPCQVVIQNAVPAYLRCQSCYIA
jgi:hypothetical protein